MSWRSRHQLVIFLVVTGFFALTAFILWFIYHPRPSCSDGKQNQNELGGDCGGACQAVCLNEVAPPLIWWQQAFSLKNHTYDLAALVENKLDHFGINPLNYIFRIYSSDQLLLTTVVGQTFLNPNERAIIYQPNVVLGETPPARVVLELAGTTWQRLAVAPTLKLTVSQGRFANQPFPQVRAVIHNHSLETYRQIEVTAVLSDSVGNAFAASQTFVDVLPADAGRELFFSWPASFDLTADGEPVIDFYPRLNTIKPKAF